MIHSSSATIGIVMGLGASGVLGWKAAVAFSLGADLGTTITSWMASLNLTKNAKRAAYAHIVFNIVGVVVMLPLFFPSMALLTAAMQWFGGDPSTPVVRDGIETFPLVPVAVGVYSIAFNIFNTALLFPFVGVLERALSHIGRDAADAAQDYSIPHFLGPREKVAEPSIGIPLMHKEMARYMSATGLLLSVARGEKSAPRDAQAHHVAIDILGREIGRYTAAMFRNATSPSEADLLARLIEEMDFTASLGQTLFQVARRVERHPFSPVGREFVDATLAQIAKAMHEMAPVDSGSTPLVTMPEEYSQFLIATRQRCLKAGSSLAWEERGRILELLGSAERAFFLINRIQAERASVPRTFAAEVRQEVS